MQRATGEGCGTVIENRCVGPLPSRQSGEAAELPLSRGHCESVETISWRLRAVLGIAASLRSSQ
jgi:hypothetical protein